MTTTTKDLVLLPDLCEHLFVSERTVYKHKENGVFIAGEHFYRVGEGKKRGKCVYSLEQCKKALFDLAKETKKVKGAMYKRKMLKNLDSRGSK
tara:strand:+ start:564 stop:842 length:279 start_codon:yes stop_codon:yes gene_type:complete